MNYTHQVVTFLGKPIDKMTKSERYEVRLFLIKKLANTYNFYIPDLEGLDLIVLIDMYIKQESMCYPKATGSAVVPASKYLDDDVEVKTCEYCKYRNRMDFSRLPAVTVLKCGNCGGIL